MTNNNRAFYKMCQGIALFCNENAAIFLVPGPFASAFIAFEAELVVIMQSISVQTGSSTGITKAKAAARIGYEAAAFQLSAAMQSYAVVAGNSALLRRVKVTAYRLTKFSEPALLGRAQLLYDAASAHLAALAPYGVDAATLTAMDALRLTFSGYIGKPGDAIRIKAAATAAMAAALSSARRILSGQMDILVRMYEATHPELMKDYFMMRAITQAGHRRRVLDVTIVDAATGAPLPGVKARLMPEKKNKKTNARGRFTLQHAHEGMQQITCTLRGYTDATATAPIVHGETAKLRIEMEKNSGFRISDSGLQ